MWVIHHSSIPSFQYPLSSWAELDLHPAGAFFVEHAVGVDGGDQRLVLRDDRFGPDRPAGDDLHEHRDVLAWWQLPMWIVRFLFMAWPIGKNRMFSG